MAGNRFHWHHYSVRILGQNLVDQSFHYGRRIRIIKLCIILNGCNYPTDDDNNQMNNLIFNQLYLYRIYTYAKSNGSRSVAAANVSTDISTSITTSNRKIYNCFFFCSNNFYFKKIIFILPI